MVLERPTHLKKAGTPSLFGCGYAALWTAGEFAAAIRLEQFWNKLLTSVVFNLFCAYPIDVFGKDFQPAALDEVLCNHTHVLPMGQVGNLESAINRAMEEVLGSKVDDVRLCLKTNFRPAWAEVPKAEAIILWLRNNLPEFSDEILTRAREHYQALGAKALGA